MKILETYDYSKVIILVLHLHRDQWQLQDVLDCLPRHAAETLHQYAHSLGQTGDDSPHRCDCLLSHRPMIPKVKNRLMWSAAEVLRPVSPATHNTEVETQHSSSCVISGFCHDVGENCTLLGYYAASSGNSLPTFQDNLLVQYSRSLGTGPISCPVTSIMFCHYSPCNSTGERSYQHFPCLVQHCTSSGVPRNFV